MTPDPRAELRELQRQLRHERRLARHRAKPRVDADLRRACGEVRHAATLRNQAARKAFRTPAPPPLDPGPPPPRLSASNEETPPCPDPPSP